MRTISKSRRTWHRLSRDTRGTELAEAAVVLPLLFMILMGIFWFGQAFRIYGTLTQATRAGARAAVAPVCATCGAGATGVANAQTAVQNVLAAAHLSTNQLVANSTWTTPAPTLYKCGSAKATQITCAGTVYRLRSGKRAVVLSGASDWAGGHGRMRHIGQRALQVSLRLQDSIYQPGSWEHSASRAGGDESGDAMTGQLTMTNKKLAPPRPPLLAKRKRAWTGESAAQIVEFAVSLPLLMLFVVGIFDFSNAVALKQKLTNAAREAARVAAADSANDLANPSTAVPASVGDAFQVVDNYLLADKVNDCGLATATSARPPALRGPTTPPGAAAREPESPLSSTGAAPVLSTLMPGLSI